MGWWLLAKVRVISEILHYVQNDTYATVTLSEAKGLTRLAAARGVLQPSTSMAEGST